MSESSIPPPFRAELIGSLVRPQAIKDARNSFDEGNISEADLKRIEDSEIKKIISLQEDLGFQVVSDGELRRSTYSESFTTHGITGLELMDDAGGAWTYKNDKGSTVGQRSPRVVDKIRWAGPTNIDNFQFIAANAKKALPKMTLPGPAYIHYRAGRNNISSDVYPNLDDFWNDLTNAYKDELKSLFDAGCRYVQLDETSIAKLGDEKIREGLAKRGDDWQDLLEAYIDAVNAVVSSAPQGMSIGIHLCRGNKQGHWQAAGGYDDIAEKLFRNLKTGFYFLEYDSPRAGSFAPLKALPDDKIVVIGAMTTNLRN